MNDERDKPVQAKDSRARPTARDVPFVRGAGSDAEPAPRGQRPEHLPRDPTYEAELAQVELAVLRDRDRYEDPSTKQGGRRGYRAAAALAPESVTPESPGARLQPGEASGLSPEPPGSSGRAVASGTLLSVGAVDPRGKTERTLETPRMFFSQVDASGEAYFKPGKIPAVTVHQTLETETVKLSDSVDPRRAKTLPRIDRSALARFAEREGFPESSAPMALAGPGSLDLPASDAAERWNQAEYDHSESVRSDHDGQIHASLSPFRGEQSEPSFSLDGVPTRPEPLAARRVSDVPPPVTPSPTANNVPTQRDLPAHRIEASQPPPAPVSAEPSSRGRIESVVPLSEGPSPTTASIAAGEPESRPKWLNFAAFAAALLLAVGLGLWLTRGSETPPVVSTVPSAAPVVVTMPAPPVVAPVAAEPAVANDAPPSAPTPTPATAPPAKRAAPPLATLPPAQAAPAAPAGDAAHKPIPAKSPRETIF